jgi:hypothetical protein
VRCRASGCSYDDGVSGGLADTPGERIAAAVGRLRARDVTVDESVQGSATRYAAARQAYRLIVIVDPARFVGLEFDLLGTDGSVRLHYFTDTGRHDITAPAQAWYASAVATDVVLFLDALADGGLLAKVESRRARLIVPTGGGSLIVKRGRVWTSAGRHGGDREAAVKEGYRPVPA